MVDNSTTMIRSRLRLQVIQDVTHAILDILSQDDLRDPVMVAETIVTAVNIEIEQENSTREKAQKWSYLQHLLPEQIADVMLKTYHIVRIDLSGDLSDSTGDMLGIYCEDGLKKGLYDTDELTIRKIVKTYCYGISVKNIEETIANLYAKANRVVPTTDKDLLAAKNGIFDYQTKQLMGFSPDFVFLSKFNVDYNPQAQNPVIYNSDDNTDWDVESWMESLFDDDEIPDLIWQIVGAVLRPNVSWNKAAWFYSEQGNNGKGTICSMIRNLCGKGTHVSLALSDFNKDFMLEPLTHASAIITDENDVGTYIDKAANLKAVITGDMLQINRKYKVPITCRFRGFMIQCLNEMPRIRDKSDSFYRRQLFIPFTKCFTGAERTYIKEDYLKRKEVLEYVMYKVLNMNYYEFTVPKSCEDALEEYKLYVDPIRAFLDEVLDEFTWKLLPSGFLYDTYVGWYKKNYAGESRGICSKIAFVKDVKRLIQNYSDWAYTDSMRPKDFMDEPEPLIGEYEVEAWGNPMYAHDKFSDKYCHPVRLSRHYRGFYKVSAVDMDDVENED